MSDRKTQVPTQTPTYRTLSYEEVNELLKGEGYKYIAGWSEFEAYAKFYCRQADGELECVKIWRNGRTGGRGGAVFRGTVEEVYCWIPWDTKGTIAPVRVKEALKTTLGVEVDTKKVEESYRSMINKVLGV